MKNFRALEPPTTVNILTPGKGAMIDPTLLHYCYAFISSHVYGSRPEGIVTVTEDEMTRFMDAKERLLSYLESQV